MSATDNIAHKIDALFASIDQNDTEAFLGFLTDDAEFRFGSAPPVQGRDAIGRAVSEFFASIAGCTHVLSETWTGPDSFACEGEVTYERIDGSRITLPFADMFSLRGEKICGYRVYIDIAPLFAR